MAYRNTAGSPASAPNTLSRGLRVADAAASNVTNLELMRPDFARRTYRVLLAHDLSGPSEIALVRAARCTLERDGHLIILHVVDSRLPAPVIEAQRARARSHIEAEVRRWLGRSELSYHIDIGVGDSASAIAARARAHSVDLVVTGRNQRRRFADMLTPTTVGRLLRQAWGPILIVRSSDQSPYRRVLIPIDFTSASAARIQFAADFLPQARLHLLHAHRRCFQDYVAPLSSALSQVGERGGVSGLAQQRPTPVSSWFIETLRLGGHRPIVTIENDDAPAAVRKELARRKTDLLVLGTQARSGTAHVPMGSVAEAALGSNRCDMLLLPLHGPS
jgi:nucleotide-binding universal stress UspA family protein